jgi:hypothetical protein
LSQDVKEADTLTTSRLTASADTTATSGTPTAVRKCSYKGMDMAIINSRMSTQLLL